MRKKCLAVALTALLMATAACGGSSEGKPGDGGSGDSGKKYTIRLASVQGPTSPAAKSMQWWAEEVKKKTNGRVTVKFFFGSSLLGSADLLPGLKDGRTDAIELVSVFNPQELPMLDVISVPFTAKTGESAARAFTELYKTNKPFQSEFEKNKMKVMFFQPIDQGIFAYSKPIESLDQIKGKRWRTFGFWANAIQEVGGNPVNIPTAELFDSLQRKVVDGVGGITLSSSVALGVHEAAPFYTDVGLGDYTSTAVAINLDKFNEFPADIQKAMTDAGEAYLDGVVDIFGDQGKADCEAIKAKGGKATLLPQAEVDRWQSMVGDSLLEEWRKKAVSKGNSEADVNAFVEEYKKIVAQVEAKPTYPNPIQDCAKL
jgi:TRAP-type C4-dicarboxylate transport system substrate-binding protein